MGARAGGGDSLRLRAAAIVAMTAAAFSTAAAQSCGEARSRIVGGEAAILADWPGQAALRLRAEDGSVSHYFCGATVIAPDWVLTAAHCVADLAEQSPTIAGAPARLEVVVGVADLRESDARHVRDVSEVVLHPDYVAALDSVGEDQASRDQIAILVGADIALIRLAEQAPGPFARLSSDPSSDPGVDEPVRVAGFGAVEFRAPFDRFQHRLDGSEIRAGEPRLSEAAILTTGLETCRARYPGAAIGAGQICAGLPDARAGSCQGDSGGPLVAFDEVGCPIQIGLVSWAAGCGEPGFATVFTRVSTHRPWIEGVVGPLDAASGPDTTSIERRSDALAPHETAQAIRHLSAVLGSPNACLRLEIEGGLTAVRLGEQIAFVAESCAEGRLLIVDVAADGTPTLIFPNAYAPEADRARIDAGARIRIPDLGAGFDGFAAVEPLGRGQLLAILVPPSASGFDIGFNAPDGGVVRGLEPIASPAAQMMRLALRIEEAQDASPDGWAFAVYEYAIIN